jgi:hypothetical protein
MKLSRSPTDHKLRAALAKRIYQIADLEKEIAASITEGAYRSEANAGKYSKSMTDDRSDGEHSSCFVDISTYCNNHGFYKKEDTRTAHFSSNGSFFLDDDTMFDRILEVGGLRFQLPALVPDGNDNISCQGQVIPVPPGQYDYISLLACSEWGNATEKITLLAEDGQQQEIMIQFTDWYEKQPVYGEKTAWRGKLGRRGMDETMNTIEIFHTIYADCYPLRVQKAITSLQLPYCPNLHLFSISLIRSKEHKNNQKFAVRE